MPGGGNVLATNHMFNIAPKDGTAIATLHTAMPLHQALGGQGVRFDAASFNWLGSMGPENSVVFAWKSAGIRSFDDLKSKEVVLGGTGAGSGIVIFPIVMNKVLGTRFKIVTGYKSSDEVNIAMERGEVEARTLGLGSMFSQNADWIRDGKIDVLAQIGAKRDKRLAEVPLLTEIAEQRRAARDPAADRRADCARQAVLRAAGRSGRPCRAPAPGVRRADEGRRVPGGHEKAQHRHRSDGCGGGGRDRAADGGRFGRCRCQDEGGDRRRRGAVARVRGS